MRPSRRHVSAAAAIGLTAALGAGLAAAVRSPRVLASGSFHQVAHKGSGTATICELPDGRRVLRLLDFSTSDHPDLVVLLISAPDAPENETVKRAESVSLGPLRAAEGNQEYAVPDGVDLDRFHAVTIWNRKYHVNFTTAPLTRPVIARRIREGDSV